MDFWKVFLAKECIRRKGESMLIVSICIIVAGISLDVADFLHRARSALRRGRVPSAIPFIGFLMVTVGLLGLKVYCDWMSTSKLILLIFLALLFELFFQILMPLLFTMACNVYYGRTLMDMSALPPKDGK